ARRTDDHHPQVPPRPGVRAGAAGAAGQHQLLPEPFRMLPGELAGQLVEAAHPLDRDEERLVRAQAGRDELVDGTAEMVFELIGVARPQFPAALYVVTPLRELRLQLLLTLPRRHARYSSGIAVSGLRAPRPSQISLRASVTVSHWRRCSAS